MCVNSVGRHSRLRGTQRMGVLLLALLASLGAAIDAGDDAALRTLAGGWPSLDALPAGDLCVQWSPLTCDVRGRAARLFFRYIDLDGPLDEAVGQLTALESLHIASCGLTGSLPAALSLLTNLTELTVELNSLEGALPASLVEDLPRLEVLDIGINWDLGAGGSLPRLGGSVLRVVDATACSFAGGLPDPIPPTLEELRLGRNGFVGPVPVSWNTAPALTQVDLRENNGLTGAFPGLFASHGSLAHLDFTATSITVPIPDLSGALGLVSLRCRGCSGLAGAPLPEWLWGLENLEALDIYRCDLEFPAAFWSRLRDLPRLKALDVSGNSVRDPLPDDFGAILPPSLTFLAAEASDITGDSASLRGIHTHVALDFLDLSSNPLLTGPLPDDLLRTSALGQLDLGRCGFNGTLDAMIGMADAPQLTDLFLNGNAFSGTVPFFSPEAFPALDYLDLGDNSLSGTIPAEFADLLLLQRFELRQNDLHGPIPARVGPRWFHIDHSNNQLSGTVPPELLEIQLTYLLLRNNRLNGAVDEVAARNVDLSCNHLSSVVGVESGAVCKVCSTGQEAPFAQCLCDRLCDNADILTEFAQSLGFHGWDNETVPSCAWPGVSCDDDNHVTAIALAGGMSGSLSAAALLRLEYLEALTLAGNGLTGSLPAALLARQGGVGTGPGGGITRGHGVKAVDLGGADLSGTLPEAGDSVETVVVAGSRRLDGPVPQSWQAINMVDLRGTAVAPVPDFLTVSESDLELVDEGRLLCPSVSHVAVARTWFVDPAMFDHVGCLCVPPLAGQPPDCQDCSGNTYAEGDLCLECPADSVTDTPGGPLAECLCEPGFFHLESSLRYCMPCLAGTWAGGLGSRVCAPCAPETVSVDGAAACFDCPRVGASCRDGRMQLLDGFWHENGAPLDVDLEIVPCRLPALCAINATHPEQDVVCREGHDGNMCAACTDGWAPFDGICRRCWPDGATVVFLLVAFAILAAVAGYLVWDSLNGAPSDLSVLLRMTITTAQSVSVLFAFDLRGPPAAAQVVRTVTVLGTELDLGLHPFMCLAKWDFFELSIASQVMPWCIAVAAAGITAVILRCKSKAKGRVVAGAQMAALVVLFQAFMTVARRSLEFFPCVKRAYGQSVHVADYSAPCSGADHDGALSVVSAAIAVNIGILALLVVRTRRNVPFLTAGYRPETWLWELVVLARKITLVLVAVVLSGDGVAQHIAAQAILGIAMAAQLYTRPFRRSDNNNVETASLALCLATSTLLAAAGTDPGSRFAYISMLLVAFGLFALFLARTVRASWHSTADKGMLELNELDGS